MSKINYAKVEERLTQALQKMFVKKLQEKAGKKNVSISAGDVVKELSSNEEAKEQLLKSMQADLQHLHKESPKIHTRLGITKKELHSFIDDPSAFKSKEWDQLQQLKKSIEKESRDLKRQIKGEETEKDQVDDERKKHEYKRFNVRKGWVPLDTYAPPPPKIHRKPGSWDVEEEE